MGFVAAVYRKEMKDHLRDRRSMASAVLFPIFGPCLFGVLFTLIASWANADRPLKIQMVGRDRAPSLMAFLERSGAEVADASPGYEQRIKDGDDDLALVIPEDYAEDFARARPATVQLVEDSSRNKAHASVEKVRQLLQLYSSEMGALRLLVRGVAPSMAAAVKVDAVDLATKQQQAANMLNMIPVFLLMGAFLGGLNVAIDTMAGERERGSLEPLVITPAPRRALVLGKWLTTLSVAAAGFSLSLVGFMVVVRRVPLEDLGARATIGGHEVLGILLAFGPLLCFTAALQMLISTYARTFKEAQSYLSLITLVPMVPGMLLSISPFKTQPWMMAVPTLGQQLLTTDVLRGEPFRLWAFTAAALGAILATLLCLTVTIRLLGKERIIFGR